MFRLTLSKGDVLEIKRARAKNTLRLVFSSDGVIDVRANEELSIKTIEEKDHDAKDGES